jgi:hypothetical protein
MLEKMTSFFLASFSFSAILFWLSSLQEQRLISRKRKGIILYFIGILSIVFRVYLNLLNPHSYRSQTSFTLVLLRLQGSTKLQSKFIITDSNMQIPLRQETLHL